MKYASSFEEVYRNGYTSKKRSLLEAEVINSMKSSSVNIGTSKLGLPPCHLNFENFGNIKFDWMNLDASPINYKLFNKLQQLSNVIRNINQAFIDLILEFKCCGIAKLYNDDVLPIFKWVLNDFIGVLIDIASGLIQGNQAFKILTCAVRPVPGNPWLKQGGMDFLTMVYSYLNGFEAVYDWIMDGNPVDMILNPVQDFYKKITSCTPINDNRIFNQKITDLGQERLNELLKSYEDNVKKDETSETRAEKLNTALKDYSKYKTLIFDKRKELNTLNDTLAYYDTTGKEGPTSEKYSNTLAKRSTVINQLNDFPNYLASKGLIESVDSISTAEEYFRNTQKEKYVEKTSATLSNDLIVQRNIDQLIIDEFNPSCSCLTGLFELGAYNPPALKTLSTWEDVDALKNTVYWGDKNIWKSSVQKVEEGQMLDSDIISNIYINRTNIAAKYKSDNSTINRDNMVTLELEAGKLITGLKLDSTKLEYTYIDVNGIHKTHTIDILNATYASTGDKIAEFSNVPELKKIYTDSGHITGSSPHKAENIETIFKLNALRAKEKSRLQKLLAEVSNDKLQIEYNFEKVWNSLRRAAIDKTRFETFKKHIANNADNANNPWYNLALFDSASYATGFKDSLDRLKGTALLAKLGDHFEMQTFLINFHNDDFNIGQNNSIYDINKNKVKWEELSEKIGILETAIQKLEALIKIDNVVIKVVDDRGLKCGCDILCKILQWILDLILSTVKALVESIIAKILKMVMNEHVAYIIKFILHKLQCAKDIAAFTDNIKKIRDKANILNSQNKQDLNKMTDPDYCNITDANISKGKQLKNDEIPLYTGTSNDGEDATDTITYPDPVFGEPSPKNSPESENVITNHGGTVDTNSFSTGKNMPTVFLDCKDSNPFLEISIVPRDSYEILVAFRPSDYITTAKVQEIEQGNLTNSKVVTDPAGNEIVVKTASDQVDSLASILEQANLKVQQALNAPVFEDTSCDDDISATPNTMTLCSSKNLWIESLYIIDSDGNKIEDFENYGSLSDKSLAPSGLMEYFPEDDNADENGMVYIEEGETYWVYKIPKVDVVVEDPIRNVVVEIVPADTDTTPHFESSTTTQIKNFATLSTKTDISITYVDNNGQLEKHTTTTKTLTVYTPFRFPDLEILGTFKNKVNHLSIRFILDVLGAGEPSLPAKYDETARYKNLVELGSLDGSGPGIYNISQRRLLFLSQQLLKDNAITYNPKAVAEEAETTKSEATPDDCLLPTSQSKMVKVNKAITENLTSAAEETIGSINKITQELPEIKTPENKKIKLPPLKKSIPFMVLNKEHDIVIQIVERKLFLQFKSNTMVNADPLIIDFELVPGDTYMFMFNTNNLTINMSLITPDKQLFRTSGINTSGVPLLPSIIGGNVDGTASFCGTILDIILSKSGAFSNDFYNRSLMSYVPRSAKILFDFSVSNGDRVYNTINKIGANFAKNTNILLDRFKNPIPNASQKADKHGTIISNAYYQVLNGYMDNFFCSENLKDKDFTISLWMYKKDTFKSSRHMILSDDINQNYVYYDDNENMIYLNFKGVENKSLFLHFDSWVHLTLKHNLFMNKFVLTIQKLDEDEVETLSINTKNQFLLMSIFAEYDYDKKRYINKFDGLLSTIVIYLSDISYSEYLTLHNEQKILVRGMEL